MSASHRSNPVPPPDSARPDAAQACAQAVLACVPLLMREIRTAMRGGTSGLGIPQFRTLIFAQKFPDASVTDLAAHLGVTLPTASAAVTGLTRRGLLVVANDRNDRRRRLIRLTRAGARIVEAAQQQTAECFTRRLQPLSKRHLNEAQVALERLRSQLNA